LEEKARDGSYWARVAVSSLRALASGRLGKDNVFVRPGSVMTQNYEEFAVFLPGCKACMERRADDQYYLVNLVIDNSYADISSDNQQTGLHKAEKIRNSWETTIYPDGKTDATDQELRIVAVADSSHDDTETAVRTIASSIAKAPDAPSGKHFKVMDIHYTHDKGRLGGLKNFTKARRPLRNEDIHGSAILLARSMIHAKNKQITWVSEKGGSAVLTQALKIVSDNKVKLKDHNLFLFDPTTSTNETIKAAHGAGIQPDRNAIKTGFFNVMGNGDQALTIINRKRGEEGYTLGNAGYDMMKLGAKFYAPIGLGVGALGLAGVSIGVPAIPMIQAIAGAIGVAATGVGALKLGDSLAENIAPHTYNKHIGKIK